VNKCAHNPSVTTEGTFCIKCGAPFTLGPGSHVWGKPDDNKAQELQDLEAVETVEGIDIHFNEEGELEP
jgi:hypothetical protein